MSKSLVSIKISSKYQLRGAVNAKDMFLLMFVTGMHVVFKVLAKNCMISLKLVLSGPTASRSRFSSECRHFYISSAISSTWTNWKIYFPSPGIGNNGNFLTR